MPNWYCSCGLFMTTTSENPKQFCSSCASQMIGEHAWALRMWQEMQVRAEQAEAERDRLREYNAILVSGEVLRKTEAERDRYRAALAHVLYLSRGRFPGIRPAVESIIELCGLSVMSLVELGPVREIDPVMLEGG